MKFGAENKKEVAIMAVLFAVLLVVGVYNFRDVYWAGTGAEVSSLPVSPVPQQKGPPTIAAVQENDPWLKLDTLRGSQAIQYEPGRNIFERQQITVPPVDHSPRSGELVDWPRVDPPAPAPPLRS